MLVNHLYADSFCLVCFVFGFLWFFYFLFFFSLLMSFHCSCCCRCSRLPNGFPIPWCRREVSSNSSDIVSNRTQSYSLIECLEITLYYIKCGGGTSFILRLLELNDGIFLFAFWTTACLEITLNYIKCVGGGAIVLYYSHWS